MKIMRRLLEPSALRTSILSLSTIQVANYLFPLITLPYLTRAIGAEGYGHVAFVQAIASYFVLFVDYGFSLSAVREISANRHDRNATGQLICSTWAAQWLLTGACTIVYFTGLALLAPSPEEATLYSVGYLAVIANVIAPTWIFQGLERLSIVAISQVTARAFFLIPIFAFVRDPGDTAQLVAIYALTTISANVAALCWAIRKEAFKIAAPSFSLAIHQLQRGLGFFCSKLSISIYTTAIPIVLGAISGPTQLGYFVLADRFRTLAQSVMAPVSTALFPRMSDLFANDVGRARTMLVRSSIAIVALTSVLSVALFFASDFLVVLIAGDDFRQAGPVLRLLAPLPLILALSNILGLQILVPCKLNKAFTFSVVAASILSLCTIFPLVAASGAKGAALNMLVVESSVALLMAYFVYRNRHKLFLQNR